MSTILESQTHGELTYTVLFESTTGALHATHLTFADDDSPEKLAIEIAGAYKQHVNRLKRVLYRGVLLKKPVVSIVTLSDVTDVSLIYHTEQQFFLQNKVHDPTLSSAIRKPAVLRCVNRDAFCRQYKNVFLEADDAVPQSAILIHQINDPTASKIVGIAGSIFSITLGLVSAFVL
ncbi:hypothetical protein FIE12Z_8089 [Fusarium flagelliforme]|uniref:Uncharacterized protein n=1 Tax=Fusarium flagelliforme TaxID=2675880 RepID=A0A395MI93_9HYPO|nr:hypothetical protein FIE12Z_8089 [Fusarium flagelliforme]